MPPLMIAAAIAVAGSAAVIGWLLLAPRDRTRQQILANAANGLSGTVDPAGAGLAGTGLAHPAALAKRVAPPRMLAHLDRLWALAGRPRAWNPERLFLVKLVLPLVIGVLGVPFVAAGPSPARVLLAAVVTVVAFFVPDLLLHSRGQERQKKIATELPDTMDQMTIAVEAGLGFEAAMQRTVKNGRGPLAAELGRTLQDMQIGRSRREAYLALSDRTTVKELRRFVRAVVQADIYGIAIADVLRTQAGEMRIKRRQRAEEQAMKIPVKVIFPLMLCILPALFIVLLGPAVIDMMKAFGGM